ncbi:MAG: response regulator [Rhodospirillales bacterium]
MLPDRPLSFFVVDDDPDIVNVITLVLEYAGHRVHSDLTGLTAIADIASKRPDVVLTDMMMMSVDGLQLCRELRKKPRLDKTRIIFVSARKGKTWHDEAAAAGADGYIEKPVDPSTFMNRIEQILDGQEE